VPRFPAARPQVGHGDDTRGDGNGGGGSAGSAAATAVREAAGHGLAQENLQKRRELTKQLGALIMDHMKNHCADQYSEETQVCNHLIMWGALAKHASRHGRGLAFGLYLNRDAGF
jgi:hypothetical protein